MGLVHHAKDVGNRFSYQHSDAKLAQVLPFCGVFGFCQMMAALAAGRPTHLLSHFSATQLAPLIAREQITHMHGTDDMWRNLFDITEDGQLSSLRACGFAAFNGQPDDLVRDGDRHGVSLVGLYGMSEVQAFFSARDPDRSRAHRARAGGRLASSTAKARVRDPETGELLSTGRQGELEVLGPSLMLGYLDDAAATEEALTDDGYLRTGDLAKMEPDGTFEYVARMGDALRLGGFLVSPAEIEAHLESSPKVVSAQVVGIQTESGPSCCAFVVRQSHSDGACDSDRLIEAELKEHCARSLAKFKVPLRIFALTEFPTTASANGTKIQKSKLRLLAQEAVDANSSHPQNQETTE